MMMCAKCGSSLVFVDDNLGRFWCKNCKYTESITFAYYEGAAERINEKNCLDKQKVKEAIQEEKWHISSHVRDCAKRIEKRLGLE